MLFGEEIVYDQKVSYLEFLHKIESYWNIFSCPMLIFCPINEEKLSVFFPFSRKKNSINKQFILISSYLILEEYIRTRTVQVKE